MTLSIALVSFLAIIHQTTSAPFNDPVSNGRTSSDISNNEWTCTYHGHDPNVNSSLDLPQLVKTLCSQVQYANAGCMEFALGGQHTLSGTVERPVDTTPLASAPCPAPLQWNTTLSICTLEIPYVPILVNVSPPGQPIMQADLDPAIIKNITQAMSGYEDGQVYAFSLGDPVRVDDDGSESDVPSVVVEQAHSGQPTPDAPLPPVSHQSSPYTASSAVMAPMMPVTQMAPTMPKAPLVSMMPTATVVYTMPTTTPQPFKRPFNNKKPAKASRPPKANTAPSTKSHAKQCGSSHSTGAFSFDSGKHSSIYSEDSGSCELSHPVHKDKVPSPHQPKSPGTKPASPKPIKHHDDSGPDLSKVTAQRFDEPEGDEDNGKPSSHQDKSIDTKPSSPKPENHHNDTEPDTSRVTAQSFDEPEGDADDYQPSGITQGNKYIPQKSYSTPVFTSQSPPQANQESPVRQQAEKECQLPSHWDSTLSLCSTPPTDQSTQMQNATITNITNATHPSSNPLEGNQRALSTPSDCEAPLQWNSVLSMCMEMSILPNSQMASKVDLSGSVNAPANLLNPQPSTRAGQTGQPINPGQACQSPSRWNAELRLCMGISALPNAESFNPSDTLAPVSGLPAQMTQNPTQMIGTTSPGSQNCDANERWSSIANNCVANSMLSSPQYGGDCGAAHYDSLIGMCLNMSILGGIQSENQDSPNSDSSFRGSPSKNQESSHRSNSDIGGSQYSQQKLNPSSNNGVIGQNSPVIAQSLKSQNTEGPLCATGQTWSGLSASCVFNDRLSKSKGDGSCEAGKYDSLIGMCLSMSVLGSQDPTVPKNLPVTSYPSVSDNGSDSQIQPITSGSVPGCSKNQRYDMLARACIDLNMIPKSIGGQDCGIGAQFDTVLGRCIDMSAAAGLFGSKTTQFTQSKSTSEILSLPNYI